MLPKFRVEYHRDIIQATREVVAKMYFIYILDLKKKAQDIRTVKNIALMIDIEFVLL